MALIKCPECGKEVSDKATQCINCGYTLKTKKLRKSKSMLKPIMFTLIGVIVCFMIAGSCYILYKNDWKPKDVIDTISNGRFTCIFGHEWNAATCTTPKICAYCNITKGEAIGHDWREADCFEPKTCTRCWITDGSALGHTTKMGTCTRCKNYISDLDDEYQKIT